MSGEALRAAEAPLVKKVRLRQLAIGSALRKMFLFVLKLNQIDEDVQLQWRQIESIDTSETWDIIKKKRDAGLPAEQIWLEHGYDTALIEQWKRAGLLDQPATTNITEIGDEAA
ncbi:phage portal protein [Rhodococcus erythropolis]|nr:MULTISPECIES: phage portal protein [Rhodococcus erythropolis group]MCD2108716.1 phage portal protein [Rhodococcus qingshengii]MCZ4527735.1 phage portal protein [Rhodococcus erythropolis]